VDTPALNRLAASGLRFTQHYSPSPLCAPARASYLTGRYNHRTGAIDVSSNRGIDRIALSERIWGDYFREAGYATALIGKWHNGLYNQDYLPHHRGFDLFFGFANGQQDYWDWNLSRNDEMVSSDGRYLTDVFNEEAIHFIRLHRNSPFSLVLAHHTPHFPLQAPAALIQKYTDRLPAGTDKSVAIIYAMIEAMDTGIGRLVKTLDDLGLSEKTIIVFTSDNGAQLGSSPIPGESLQRFQGPFSGNKGYVLEQGIRVPAIVSWPMRLKAGRVVSTPIHGTDWLPTLFALTGSKPPTGAKPLDGRNLDKLLFSPVDEGREGRPLFFQKNRYTPVRFSDAAVREGPWKLYWPGVPETMRKDLARDNYSFERGIVELPWEMPIDPQLPDFAGIAEPEPRLYNLDEDPSERFDQAAEHPVVVDRLRQKYVAWFASVSGDWAQAYSEIVAHDADYWARRTPPDPAKLFADYWRWDKVDADPESADPLEVFIGYWNYDRVTPTPETLDETVHPPTQ
jgi:arylsulfatase A